MGLVVQAPLDALLPAIDAQPVGAATGGSGQAAADGLFASLLASLSATLDDATTGDLSETLIEAGDIAPEGDDKKDVADPFAALFAATVPLPVLTMAQPATVGNADTGTVEALSATTAEVRAETLQGEPLPLAGVAEAQTEAIANEPPATEAPAPVEVTTPAAAPAASEASLTTDSAAAAVAEASQIVAAQSPEQPTRPAARAERPEGPPTEAAEPPGQGTVQTEATSVVRPVGNAENEQEMGAGSQPQTREKDTVERPQPRASAQGIANAAPNSAAGELRAAQDAAPVEVAAPVESPAPAMETAPQVEQVASAVIERVEAGGGEARIHLDPAGLGEVTIQVRTQGDTVSIDVRAERQEAANLLRDHTQDLSNLLGERGLNLSDVNVGLGRGNGEQAWGQDSRPETRPANGEFANILGVDEAQASIDRHQRLRAAYNPDGAHLYRV